MLEKWYEFGKIDWVSELEYPEWTVKLEGFEKETFEHQELPDNSTQKDALYFKRPIWLPLLSTFINKPSADYLDKQSEIMLQSLLAYQNSQSESGYKYATID